MIMTQEKSINVKIGSKEGGYTIQAEKNGRRFSLSLGNKKLPKETLIFNLPAKNTCPGKTEFCASKCYALKAERIYKNTRESRERNNQEAKNIFFVGDMIETIEAIKKKRTVKACRIHESGDFFGQDYLNKWFSIAKKFPDMVFYAYTKSFHLDFTDKPKNFILIASFDKTTRDIFKAFYNEKMSFFDRTFSIVDKTAPADCIQDCTKCNVCFDLNLAYKDITVNLH